MKPFKRIHTMYTGGDLRPKGKLTGERFVPQQRVTIVQPIPETGDEEQDDRFIIRTADGNSYEVGGEDLHPHPNAPETNVEAITRLMEWSNNGALMQGFVIEAVAKYAEQVQNMPQDQRDRMDAGLLPYAPWKACADEALAFVNAHTKG